MDFHRLAIETQKYECRLEICCSLLVGICVAYTRLSREKYRLEFCISGWNRMLQPYIESAPHSDDDEQITRISCFCRLAEMDFQHS